MTTKAGAALAIALVVVPPLALAAFGGWVIYDTNLQNARRHERLMEDVRRFTARGVYDSKLRHEMHKAIEDERAAPK